MVDTSPDEQDRGERFTRLLIAHERRLRGFVLTLIGRRQDVEDLMQEVCAVLWRKFDQFEEGTHFAAWAMQTARLCVFEWRRKHRRAVLPLQESDFETLANEAQSIHDIAEDRQEALRRCVAKLDPKTRRLLDWRYAQRLPVKEVAERLGHSPQAVYKALHRAHRALQECMVESLQSRGLA